MSWRSPVKSPSWLPPRPAPCKGKIPRKVHLDPCLRIFLDNFGNSHHHHVEYCWAMASVVNHLPSNHADHAETSQPPLPSFHLTHGSRKVSSSSADQINYIIWYSSSLFYLVLVYLSTILYLNIFEYILVALVKECSRGAAISLFHAVPCEVTVSRTMTMLTDTVICWKTWLCQAITCGSMWVLTIVAYHESRHKEKGHHHNIWNLHLDRVWCEHHRPQCRLLQSCRDHPQRGFRSESPMWCVQNNANQCKWWPKQTTRTMCCMTIVWRIYAWHAWHPTPSSQPASSHRITRHSKSSGSAKPQLSAVRVVSLRKASNSSPRHQLWTTMPRLGQNVWRPEAPIPPTWNSLKLWPHHPSRTLWRFP